MVSDAARAAPVLPGASRETPASATQRRGADSEVGPLRTVMLHRPGAELTRLTPRNNDALLFDGIPWVSRAQEEHDAFADALRQRDVEVLYLTDLLTESLSDATARAEAEAAVLVHPRLGSLAGYVGDFLRDLPPAELVTTLTAGLRRDELLRGGGLAYSLMAPEDFIIDPLPNLLFTRDSSVWLRDRVAVTSLALPARVRETTLTSVIYTHHPRFAGVLPVYEPRLEPLEGGDVLLLAAGVVAVGTGERTTPAGAERFAQQLLASGLAHTVLAVPIAQDRATMHLDTVCTMVDRDAVVMYPNLAQELVAYTMRAADDDRPGAASADDAVPTLSIEGPTPFLEAAARAMQIDRLRLIGTGLDPVTAEREQWDDGNNTLAIGPRLAVAYERNAQTNARLEEAGIQVVAIAGAELGSGRGGPRCMSCPILREP